ncbi:MAG: hypothetical protein L0H70_02565, partial [Xanthomonadales bacterium]|nr:hypothetical protein [Xanthomonadales bacterium]
GGIYAMGNFSLGGGSIIAGNTVTGVWYGWGGGLYSGGTLTVQSSGAVVNTNTATVTSRGYARGGGVYAANGIIGSALTLSYNTVQGTGGTGSIAQEVVGGGAYVGAIWIINLTANGNHALGPNSKGGGLYVHKTSYISGSSFTNNDAGIQGGGVYTEDTATIKTSTISDNIAGSGGGIYALANLDLATSTVADNTASASNGGGIYAFNGLRVDDSNITGNHAENSRGGISAYGNIAISSSTIANNTSPGVAGAGLGSASTTNPISIVQSTIVGNESTNSLWGTGLYLLHDASIKNSTIARNFSRNTSDTRYGAGISLSSGVQLTLSSSIVSGNGLNWGNSPMNLPQPDDIGKDSGVSVAYNISGSHNMIGYSTVTTPVDTIGQAGMFLGQTGLNALADNGGPTLTAMPGPTSLAIDNGTDNNYDCDQRHDGHARIVGFAADIGAVEVQDNENPDRIFASGFEVVSTSCN